MGAFVVMLLWGALTAVAAILLTVSGARAEIVDYTASFEDLDLETEANVVYGVCGRDRCGRACVCVWCGVVLMAWRKI